MERTWKLLHIGFRVEGRGDLVSRIALGRFRVTIWDIGAISLLTKSP